MMTQKEASKLIDETFAKMVGQTIAKRKLKTKILAALQDGFFSSLLLVGPAGLGKSQVMELVIFLVKSILGRRVLSYARGEECGTKTAFGETLVSYMHDKPVFVSIDEVHECKAPVRGLIRSLIQPKANRSGTTIALGNDYELTFNPLQNSFLLATNEVDKLDAPFLTRVDRIDLSPYTDEEMAEILHRMLASANVKFNENTLADIAACNRGTARDAVKWCDAIRAHLAVAGKLTINKADVKAILLNAEIFPLGVSANELRTLLALEKNGGMQLKQLAAVNMVAVKEQNANELYLLKRVLIETCPLRRLTPEGIKYLASLRKSGFLPAND